jgi:Lon protease-like protein
MPAPVPVAEAMSAGAVAAEPGLPLFPLRVVLFPGGLLPLRIFEPRYVDMVSRCLREGREFGVLHIEAGEQSDAPPQVALVGTAARIIDFNRLEDGLLGLLCIGTRRFRLRARQTQADGLHVGEVDWLPPPAPVALPAEHRELVPVLRGVLGELGELARHLEPAWEDAGWLADRFAELLPLERNAQQALLEMDDPLERLALLAPLIDTGAAAGD